MTTMRRAERRHTLHGTTKSRRRCAGCYEVDSKSKLVVERLGVYHPKCYQEMVAKWPN